MHAALLALPLALGLALSAPAHAANDIDKVNGSIRAESGRQYGRLETVNGSIRIGANAQTGHAETVNGSIRVDAGARTGELSTVNGAIHVEDGVRIGGNVNTVNGGIFVDRGGVVSGGISTVNGSIGLVDTDVTGGIETVTGDVTVGAGSHVRGDLRVEKPNTQWFRIGKQRDPRIVIGPNARVDGRLVFERDVELFIHATARTGAITGATPQRYSTDAPPRR